MYSTVPDYYMCQVQGQLEVLDYEDCDFAVWTPEGGVIWRVVRDEKYWAWMEPKLAEFWAYVVADVPPPRFKRGTKPTPPDASKLIVETRYYLND